MTDIDTHPHPYPPLPIPTPTTPTPTSFRVTLLAHALIIIKHTWLSDGKRQAFVQETDGLDVQTEAERRVPEKGDSLQKGRVEVEGGPAVLWWREGRISAQTESSSSSSSRCRILRINYSCRGSIPCFVVCSNSLIENKKKREIPKQITPAGTHAPNISHCQLEHIRWAIFIFHTATDFKIARTLETELPACMYSMAGIRVLRREKLPADSKEKHQ